MYHLLLCCLFTFVSLTAFAQRQWQATPSLDGFPIHDFHATTDGLLIAMSGGALQKTTNEGETWRNIPFEGGLEGNTFFTQFTQIGNTIYVGARNYYLTQKGGIFKSTDEGETWTAAYNSTLLSTHVHALISINDRLIAGTRRGIFTSDNGGDSWQWADFDKVEARYYETRCLAVDGQTIVGGSGKFIYVSKDGGNNWEAIQVLPGSANIVRLVAINGRFYAASTGFGFYQSDDGFNWEKLNLGLSETQQNVGAILPVGDDIYYSAAGNVYRKNAGESTSEVVQEGFTMEAPLIRSFKIYKGILYAGTNWDGVWKYDFLEDQERPLMAAYPNPSAADNLTLMYEVETVAQLSITLVDANGKRLRILFEGRADIGSYQIDVDLTDFTDGNYFIHYRTKRRQSNIPLVIAR